MRVLVLGAGAGGGCPQWNCGCSICDDVRRGRLPPRTQDSVAVSATGQDWVLLNASPDILQQLAASPELHPRAGRHSPVRSVMLTNGDLDHVLGLFSLRESTPLTLYATEAVYRGLVEHNAMMRTLRRFDGQLRFVPLRLGEPTVIEEARSGGLQITPFAVPGKLPIHLVGQVDPSAEDTIGVRITDRETGRSLVYASAAAGPGAYLDALDGADMLLFDGTFFRSDELVALGLGTSRAEDMAHWPVGGPAGSLATLRARPGLAPRRFYTHINNTNPMLRPDSPERAEVEAAGFQVGHDGVRVTL